MHGPCLWVHLYLRPEEPADLAHIVKCVYPTALRTMARSFIRPVSMELCVPGKAIASKFPTSIDGSICWADCLDVGLFPGEEVLPGLGLTVLSATHEAMDYDARPGAIDRWFGDFYALATQKFARYGAASGLQVSFACWGLTKCFVSSRAVGRVEEGWFLKGRLARSGHFTPILRLFLSHSLTETVDRLNISFLTCSNVYSLSEYDNGEPATLMPRRSREGVDAACANARHFAECARDLAQCLGARTPVRWEIDCSRDGNFSGAVPEMLSRFLGAGRR